MNQSQKPHTQKRRMGHPAGAQETSGPGLEFSDVGILPSRWNLALFQHGQEETKEEIRKEARQKEARSKA
jgi:hypothetical protein